MYCQGFSLHFIDFLEVFAEKFRQSVAVMFSIWYISFHRGQRNGQPVTNKSCHHNKSSSLGAGPNLVISIFNPLLLLLLTGTGVVKAVHVQR